MMYVRLNRERRGFDMVQRVAIEFDDGSRIVITDTENKTTLALRDSALPMMHTGTLTDWANAAMGAHGRITAAKR